VRRARRVGRQAAEGTQGRECQGEEAARRGDARQRHAEGHQFEKIVTPVARREAVAHLRTMFEVSERRVSRARCGPNLG
jgi:putative transposase